MAATSGCLLTRPDHGSIRRTILGPFPGFGVGAANRFMGNQMAPFGHPGVSHHTANSTAAAASAPERTGARPMKKNAVTSAVTVTRTPISRP